MNNTLRIVPISQDFGISRYYANGAIPADPDSKTFHDTPESFAWDMIAFGNPEAEPITIMPSETFEDLIQITQLPNPYGYIAGDFRSSPNH